jgi:hypothetical protein
LGGLEKAFRQWVPIGGDRLTWVARDRLALRGLASARRRGRPSAWEVDYLIVESGEESIAAGLLEEVTRGLGRACVEKVFIRLETQDRLLDVARSAGFFPYLKEQLWRLERVSEGLDCPPLPMRPRTPADMLPLFQLYNAAVPAAVRRYEALNLREWVAMQERGRCRQFVLEKDGRVAAWLRLARHDGAGCFALLAARRHDAPLDDLLAIALNRLHDRRPIFCLVPEYEKALAARLPELGFQPAAEYMLLANRLVRPIEEAAPVPAGAHQPYPVS